METKMKDDTINAREARLRRRAARVGLKVEKTRARKYRPDGGYMLCKGNIVVVGCWHQSYDATLDEIEQQIEREEARMFGSYKRKIISAL
jgi:hypothetical protein